MNTFKLLLALIRSEIFGETLSSEVRDRINGEALEQIYSVSKSHDLAHIVGSALSNNDLKAPEDISKKFQKNAYLALCRYERVNFAYQEIVDIFESEKIAFVPLKGAVIREMYPQPWLRTSSDIDVLIHKEELDRAMEALINKGGFTKKDGTSFHDVSLISPDGTHLELHFRILEKQDNIEKLISRVWEYCSPIDEKSSRCQMDKEYFVFYHIAHMLYHFLRGGCGIKPFIDMCLINQKLGYDVEKARKLCAECGIDTFYDNVMLLTNVWFGNEQHTHTTEMMEEYLITGGVYGTRKNHISVESKRSGGRLMYIMKRIFMPYKELKQKYPVLEKCCLLLPVCHVRRWWEILTDGRFSGSLKELNAIKRSDPNASSSVDSMLKDLGL